MNDAELALTIYVNADPRRTLDQFTEDTGRPAVWGGDAEASFDETQGLLSALRSGRSSCSRIPERGVAAPGRGRCRRWEPGR